ncbi:integrase core domain protein, partial [Escherichia coli 6-537-08_S1_C2]
MSIKNDGHYFCRAGGNRPDGLNEPVTCSDGFEFCCDNGERLRVTFALDCCDREALHWAVTTGDFNSETVQDVMLGAVERRFGNDLPSSPVEWLTDNGSCYRANETR